MVADLSYVERRLDAVVSKIASVFASHDFDESLLAPVLRQGNAHLYNDGNYSIQTASSHNAVPNKLLIGSGVEGVAIAYCCMLHLLLELYFLLTTDPCSVVVDPFSAVVDPYLAVAIVVVVLVAAGGGGGGGGGWTGLYKYSC